MIGVLLISVAMLTLWLVATCGAVVAVTWLWGWATALTWQGWLCAAMVIGASYWMHSQGPYPWDKQE